MTKYVLNGKDKEFKIGDILFVRMGSRKYCTLLEANSQKQWVSCSIQGSPAETVKIVPISFFEFGEHDEGTWFLEKPFKSPHMEIDQGHVLDTNMCHGCKHRLSKVVSNCCAAQFEPVEG